MRKKFILRAFKKKFTITLGMIIFVIIAISALSFLGFKYNHEHQTLINTLGSQRYVMQQMSRDSYKIYIYLDHTKNDEINYGSESSTKGLNTTQKQLSDTQLEFKKTLESISNGVMTSNNSTLSFKDSLINIETDIKDINALWADMSPLIDIMINAEGLDQEVINASIKIGTSSDDFINKINIINSTIIENNRDKFQRSMLVVVLLGLFAVLVLFLLWTNLYKNILLPIDAILTNTSSIGLFNNSLVPSNNKSDNGLNPLVDEVNELFGRLNSLIKLIENINNNSSFNDVLKYIYYSFTPFIPFTYIGMALIEDNGTSIKAAYGISDESLNGPSPANNLLGFKTSLDDTSLIHVIKTGKPRIINDLERYTRSRPLTEYNKIILDAGIKSSITLPIKYNNEAIGIIFFSSKHKDSYSKEHARFLETIANSIAIAFSKNIFIKDLILSSIVALAKLAESRDEDTGDHLNRMKLYSRTIAELLYKKSKYRPIIYPEFIEDIERFSPLHDIGKVGVADRILLKPGKLTPEEFEEMKLHATYGANVLRAANKSLSKDGKSLFKLGIEIAENHHEKWDGSGYPNGRKGEEIPLSARIVAVADVFDALTSRRPYKEPFPIEKCFEMITEGSGKHFDPEIVRTFIENKSVIMDLYNEFKMENQLK